MSSPTRQDAVVMFVAGSLAGGVVGLVVGALLQRRSGGASVLESRALTTAIALAALVVSAFALAQSEGDRDRDGGTAAATAITTTTSATAPTSTTTPATVATGLVTVPNVSRPPLTRKDAEAMLKQAHLEVSVETLALANVPPGYVISQNPLPEARTKAGSTVMLVVSAVA